MKNFMKKSYRWVVIYSIILTIFTGYVLLDAFVIPKGIKVIEDNNSVSNGSDSQGKSSDGNIVLDQAVITETTYQDSNISITITTQRKYDTQVYIADVQVSSIEYLKTAFANGTYGRNIRQTTSEQAKNNNAILAINGDYYGFRDYGFVIRNGVLYRSTASKDANSELLIISNDGTFSVVNESKSSAQNILDNGAVQALSFGPSLVLDSEINVTQSSEVSQSKTSNPRTAIGMVTPLHYIMVVADGRTSASEGLSLYELASVMKEQGCTVAYNLDGGGSSTMWFNGEPVNVPTDGNSIGERKVSDIVYIGY